MNEVILECEQGHQWEPEVQDFGRLLVLPCPICNPPEPTYGDLDVETVAAWLDEMWDGSPSGDRLRNQARAVIRLANEAYKRSDQELLPTPYEQDEPAAAWLYRIGKGEG